MIDTNRIEINIRNVESLVSSYIKLNYSPPKPTEPSESSEIRYAEKIPSAPSAYEIRPKPQGIISGLKSDNADSFDFLKLFKKNEDESFSQMLLRLINESGKKRAVIYARANIDRRHFSKIANHDDYQPSKQTVLAFAIALKLGFEKTKALLASAGFTLSNANLADVIVSAFIENKIFDINLVNQILYKYDQPLLGS